MYFQVYEHIMVVEFAYFEPRCVKLLKNSTAPNLIHHSKYLGCGDVTSPLKLGRDPKGN